MPEAHNPYDPDWEPYPHTLTGKEAALQKRGFDERADWPIQWVHLPRRDEFPQEGVFGLDREALSSIGAVCYALHQGENLILIQNDWFGWPDPPEWGLASKPIEPSDAKWKHWGHFPRCPLRWKLPTGLP